MKKGLFLSAALLAAATVCGNDFLEWRTPLVNKADSAGVKTGFMRLDAEIYSKIGSICNDLRVVDAQGNNVACFIKSDTRPDGLRHYRSVPSKLTGVDIKDNIGIFIVENLQKQPVGQINVHTKSRDFFKSMTVEKSDDGKDWTPVGEAVKIFDYSCHADFSAKETQFPPESARFFRIKLSDFVQKQPCSVVTVVNGPSGKTETFTERRTAIRVDRFELMTPAPQRYEAVTMLYPVTVKSIDEGDRSTIIEIKTDLEPLTGFRIMASDPAFSRRVKVFVDNDGDMVAAGSGVIERLPEPGRPPCKKNLIQLGGVNRSGRFRIEIYNGDAAPLNDLNITGIGLCYKLYFNAAQPDLKLYFGKNAPIPDNDAQAILEKAGLDNAVEFFHTTPERNPDFRINRWTLIKQYIPSFALIVLVAAVGIALWRVFRSVDKNEE
ncbi:MAG: hypothetical protein PHI35_06905 [Victivallaceae bacterium]|nr:hypothetical protein [Victivallaceae bacterium]